MTDTIEARKAQVKYHREFGYWQTLSENEKLLRIMLFEQHGSSEHYLYGDDGERVCNSCMCDFKRDTVEELQRKLYLYNMNLLIAKGIVKVISYG
jgi:hypothetical protein